MKTLIVYSSFHHFNTKEIASAIGQALKGKVIPTHRYRPGMIRHYDLVGFGSGIYYQKHHPKLLARVEKSPSLKGKKVFIFSTAGLPRIPLLNDPHLKLRRALRAKGYRVTGEFSCCGWDTYRLLKLIGGINRQHPNKKDCQRAIKFAQKLKTG